MHSMSKPSKCAQGGTFIKKQRKKPSAIQTTPTQKRTIATKRPRKQPPHKTTIPTKTITSLASPSLLSSTNSSLLTTTTTTTTTTQQSNFSSQVPDKDSLDPNIAYSMQGHNSEQGVKRWYRNIDVAPEPNNQWAVLLNGRYARTNRNNRLIVPTKAYALACAMEFENQTTFMIPHTMPMVEMAKIAIDRTPEERVELTDNIMAIFNCDSAMMRSDPEMYPALSRAQSKVFDPMIAWVEKELNLKIETCSDFWGSDQPDATNEKVFEHINALNPYQFIVLDNITALGKSAIVGLNFLHDNINIEQAVRGSLMEEYYQIKVSGNQVGDTYGTWLLDAGSRHRCASHRQAMLLLDYQLDETSNWKM